MKTKLFSGLGILLAIGISACGSKKVVMDAESGAVTKAGVIAVNVNWIKDKKKKFDIEFKLTNERTDGKALIVNLAEIKCGRGTDPGEMKHTFFNTGEKTINLHGGETKQFRTVCRIGKVSEGKAFLEILRVYDNPANDGKTIGKILAQKIRWQEK